MAGVTAIDLRSGERSSADGKTSREILTMGTAKVAGVNVSTAHFIDGKRVESKRTFENCSPIDGKHLADVSAGGPDEIDAAVAAARRAFPKWAALGPEGRLPILSRFAKAILDHGKETAAVETEDNGSLLMANQA